ncbi:MAG: trypsin-like serine protease [Alphaproteobacteria bacterium]|nr:trypsin-like serine protease [Alphaproteobacteria bacterium]
MTLLRQLSDELESLVARAAPAVASVRHGRGAGSATVVAPDGYLPTNAHVVAEQKTVAIRCADGWRGIGAVIGRDPVTDLAVLRVDAPALRALPLRERNDVRVGELVVAIGNPLGFERSVALGVVSSTGRAFPLSEGRLFDGFVQTDVAINPGNSGGPFVDAHGRIVGINTAVAAHAQGIGLAIPAKTAAWVASVLIRRGRIERPLLGIEAYRVELGMQASADSGATRAVKVVRVGSDGPAHRGGIRGGDLVLTANGLQVGDVDDLKRAMVFADGEAVSLDVLRESARHRHRVWPERRAA